MAKDPPSSCTILWSTQSGRAKACSRRIARILRETTSLEVTVGGEVDDYGFLQKVASQNSFWIFCISTTGDGEQCDSIQQTWKILLSKSLSSTFLQNQQFCLFSLGDRAYGPQFCAAGRKLAARLVQLGALPICPIGYGDDATPNGGVFSDLDEWLETWLLKLLPKRTGAIVESELTTPTVTWRDGGATDSLHEEWMRESYQQDYQEFFSKSCPRTAYEYTTTQPKAPLVGRVVSNERITASTWEQDTRHVCIRLDEKTNGDGLPYRAGDICTVFPANSDDDVKKLVAVLPRSIQSIVDCCLNIDSRDTTQWPRQCTLRGLLQYCADIQGLPEREDLRALSKYCDLAHAMGRDQRDKLLSLSDTDGAALYADYVLREKRCWADVFYDFDSLELTVEILLAVLPPMRPRHFSIASAPSQDASGEFHVELCVAVVKGTTPLGRSYHGLCSSYLASLSEAAPVQMWIRPGSFQELPLELNEYGRFETPILCIGAGTGIAPLRSLLLEREAIFKKRQAAGDTNVGDEISCDNLLVFGCRKKSADFYYQDTWEALEKEKRLRLWTAFSRDQWHKIYVQQVLRDADEGKLVAKHILEHGGAIYVAGGAKMARAVKEQVLECLSQAMGNDEKAATLLLKRLNRQGRYNVEAWS